MESCRFISIAVAVILQANRVQARFGEREGTATKLADVQLQSTACEGDPAFDAQGAAECCDMYVRNPLMVIGKTWGGVSRTTQTRWTSLHCDKLAPHLRRARAHAATGIATQIKAAVAREDYDLAAKLKKQRGTAPPPSPPTYKACGTPMPKGTCCVPSANAHVLSTAAPPVALGDRLREPGVVDISDAGVQGQRLGRRHVPLESQLGSARIWPHSVSRGRDPPVRIGAGVRVR